MKQDIEKCDDLPLFATIQDAEDEINRIWAVQRETSLQRARRIGGILLQVKGRLAHGEFIPWIEDRCPFGQSNARKMMILAKRYHSNDLSSHDDRTVNETLGYFSNGKTVAASSTTGEVEWYTPSKWLDLAREAMGGIDCDPASSAEAQKRVKATRFYTAEDDGLIRDWKGRVWMNPPYKSGLVDRFASKFLEQWSKKNIEQGIVLINNATDTSWFHSIAAQSECVCFPRGRIAFVNKQGEEQSGAAQGQAFFYFGNRLRTFVRVFGEHGLTMQVVE